MMSLRTFRVAVAVQRNYRGIITYGIGVSDPAIFRTLNRGPIRNTTVCLVYGDQADQIHSERTECFIFGQGSGLTYSSLVFRC